MTRILVVSNEPLGQRLSGPAIRYTELGRVLAARGHAVTLAAPGADPAAPDFPTISLDAADLPTHLASAQVVLAPAAMLALVPALLDAPGALVVDLYDPLIFEVLAEGVARDGGWRRQRHDLVTAAFALAAARGDFFICASERQRDYWLGLLTGHGRVNPLTYAEDPTLRRLVDLVPFGLPAEPPQATDPVLRGVWPGIAPGDRVLLWAGGIYDWLDPLTPIRAMDRVHRVRDDVRLVFLATAHPNPAIGTSHAAREAMALSQELGLLDAHVFFGQRWVPYETRAGYLLEADVGVSAHLPGLETRYSYRTRLLDHVWAGLPTAATAGDVLTETLAAEGLAHLANPGDDEALARAILDLLAEPDLRERLRPGFQALADRFRWERVAAPLVDFCAAPRTASDRATGLADAPARAAAPPATLWGKAWRVWRDRGTAALWREVRDYLRWRWSTR